MADGEKLICRCGEVATLDVYVHAARCSVKLTDDEEHRHFLFWCANCATMVRVETAERGEDDYRGVLILPDPPSCPMCEIVMHDIDLLAASGDVPLNTFSWTAFRTWFDKYACPAGEQEGEVERWYPCTRAAHWDI